LRAHHAARLRVLVVDDQVVAFGGQIAGHGKQSVTHDIYSHVLLDEPAWRLGELRRAVGTATGLGNAAPLTEVER